jgi:aryl-alcohol dehydrogenase-like predicted oxidoreductase
MGCWAIGGPFWYGDNPVGWGEVDDEESVRAVHRALDLGVTFFDTADVYGAGHSERVLGRAVAGRRDEVVIATKWGLNFDETTKQISDDDGSTPEYLRRAVDASLGRLGTDRIDLYQLHLDDLPIDQAADLLGVLEDLVTVGKVRAYGWSTDLADRAETWGRDGVHCTAVQHGLSVLQDAPDVLDVCARHDLASVNRSPLAMGLLTGKYTAASTLGRDDIRGVGPRWLEWFREGRPAPRFLRRVAAVRDVLTGDGRTLAQGALAWIWARDPRTVPIPGCRTAAQVEENAAALDLGPLTPAQVDEIGKLLTQPELD